MTADLGSGFDSDVWKTGRNPYDACEPCPTITTCARKKKLEFESI